MTRINPGTYHYLKRESLWSSAVKEAAIKGLYDAIKENIMPLEAYRALSELFGNDKQWDRAVQSYEKMIALKSFSDKNIFKDYIRLGQLNLKRDRTKLAIQNFLAALDLSKSRDDTLEQIYRVFQKEKCSERYAWLHMHLKRHLFDPVKTELIYAHSLSDSNNHVKAKQILEELVETKKVAQAYYLLARIAQIENNWKAMEKASLEALALDPDNIRYIKMVHSIYWQFDKLTLLEKELNSAIERLGMTSAWLYHARASLYFKRKDFQNAAKDWKVAIRIAPKRDHYYAKIAETYFELGDINKALTYYQQAIQINPRNKNYSKRLKVIKTKASEV